MEECLTNTDCSVDGIVQVCYEKNNFVSGTFFCECSNWHGWTGVDCNKPTATIWWLWISTLLYMIWCLVIFAFTTKTIHGYIKLRGLRPLNKVNPIFAACLCICMSCLLYLIYHVIRIPSFYDSTYFKVVNVTTMFSSEDIESVTRIKSEEADFLFLLGGLFQSFCAMTVISSWLDVLINFSSYFETRYQIFSERCIKKFIGGTMFVALVSFAVLAALNYFLEVVFVYFVVAILLTMGYTVAYLRLRNTVHEFLQEENGGKDSALYLVGKSFRFNVFCLQIISFGALIYYMLSIYRDRVIPIGGFNYALLFYDLANIAGMAMLTYMSIYVSNVYLHLKTHDFRAVSREEQRPKTSCCFPCTSRRKSPNVLEPSV